MLLCQKSSKQNRRLAELNKELPEELKRKKNLYDFHKRDQALREDCGIMVLICREKT